MNADEYRRLKENLELTGLNDKQVNHLLNQVKYMVEGILYRAKNVNS